MLALYNARLAMISCKDSPVSSQVPDTLITIQPTVATVAKFSQIFLTQTDTILVDRSKARKFFFPW